MVENNKTVSVSVMSSPEKSIPKFCTGLGVNTLENGDVIVSFFNQSPSTEPVNSAPLVLIETIIMNKEGIKKFAEALKSLLVSVNEKTS